MGYSNLNFPILEFTNLSAFPTEGASSKIYIANDTKKIYQWSSTVYIELSPSSGGGGTTVNVISQEVNFGTVSDFVSVTVLAAWVTPTTVISLTITPNLTDHDIEDVLIEEITCTYGNIINGVSFDVYVFAPNETHGRYIIKGLGV